MTKVTYPSGRAVDYAFDDRGQLETVDWDGSTIETIGYDDLGRLTSVDRPFVDEARTYDAGGRLTAVNNTNVGDASYTYDANGNKQSESWTGVMAGWNFSTTNTGTYPSGYDDEDRFRNFVQSAKSVDLFLDRSNIGNITNYKLGTTDAFRSYSNTHELTTIDGTSQTFDVDGQLTDSHAGIELDWDEAGMLSSTVVSSGDTAGIEGTNEYGYDASQKRAWKKITRSGSVAEHTVFIYAGPNCIAEYASGTAATSPNQEYVYGQGIDSLKMIVRSGGSQKLTVTRNQQWSISALADHSNGTVLERYTYDAFGKRTILAADGSTVRTVSSYDNPYGYTSRRHDDESGLMYFRARYYDTETGEFGSLDPLEFVDGMSQHRFYIGLMAVDPFGFSVLGWRAKLNPSFPAMITSAYGGDCKTNCALATKRCKACNANDVSWYHLFSSSNASLCDKTNEKCLEFCKAQEMFAAGVIKGDAEQWSDGAGGMIIGAGGVTAGIVSSYSSNWKVKVGGITLGSIAAAYGAWSAYITIQSVTGDKRSTLETSFRTMRQELQILKSLRGPNNCRGTQFTAVYFPGALDAGELKESHGYWFPTCLQENTDERVSVNVYGFFDGRWQKTIVSVERSDHWQKRCFTLDELYNVEMMMKCENTGKYTYEKPDPSANAPVIQAPRARGHGVIPPGA